MRGGGGEKITAPTSPFRLNSPRQASQPHRRPATDVISFGCPVPGSYNWRTPRFARCRLPLSVGSQLRLGSSGLYVHSIRTPLGCQEGRRWETGDGRREDELRWRDGVVVEPEGPRHCSHEKDPASRLSFWPTCRLVVLPSSSRLLDLHRTRTFRGITPVTPVTVHINGTLVVLPLLRSMIRLAIVRTMVWRCRTPRCWQGDAWRPGTEGPSCQVATPGTEFALLEPGPPHLFPAARNRSRGSRVMLLMEGLNRPACGAGPRAWCKRSPRSLLGPVAHS
jgi:hypothetical protein